MRKQLSDSAVAWILTIGLFAFCILVIATPSISSVVTFHHAIDLLQNGEYEKAADLFEDILPKRKFFEDNSAWYRRCSKREQNAIYLAEYAKARAYADDGDWEYAGLYLRVAGYLYGEYDGVLADEVNAYKQEIQPAVEAAEAEKEREVEQRRQEELEYACRLEYPREGLAEIAINSTKIGHCSESERSEDRSKNRWYDTKYYWRNVNGDIYLIVLCKDGKVKSISKYGIGYLWNSDGTQRVYNPLPNPALQWHYDGGDDDYGDYADFDDFYDDYYDDFDSYEDAEDYYYSHY